MLQNFANNGKPKVAFFALGPMRSIADNAIEELGTENIDAAIINPRFTKPIDAGTTEFFARAADVIVTIEDHVLKGGYGSIVRDHLADQQIQIPVVRIGWPDEFIEHASSVGYLRDKHGLSGGAAAEKNQTSAWPSGRRVLSAWPSGRKIKNCMTRHCHKCGKEWTLDGQRDAVKVATDATRICASASRPASFTTPASPTNAASALPKWVTEKHFSNFCRVYFDFALRDWSAKAQATYSNADEAETPSTCLFGDVIVGPIPYN